MRSGIAWVLVLLAATACVRTKVGEGSGGADGGVASSPAQSAPAPAETPVPDEEVRPVYPLDGGADPLAVRFCDALYEAPARRTVACCAGKGQGNVRPTAECVRNVSGALRLGGVTLAAADVEACARAVDASLVGCGCVGPRNPPVVAACAGVLHGVFVAGQRCRSSLECGGGLHCAGAGPTDVGTCVAAADEGGACSRGVDTLATFARQDSFEADHPSCKGFCRMGRCRAVVAVGGACQANAECARGALCIAGACAKGKPGAAGEPCPAGACEGALLCKAGTCTEPKGEGERCELPWDCRSGVCTTAGDASRACAPACPR